MTAQVYESNIKACFYITEEMQRRTQVRLIIKKPPERVAFCKRDWKNIAGLV